MKKILLILIAALMVSCAGKHDLTVKVVDNEGNIVPEATVYVTREDVPDVHNYISAYESELGHNAFVVQYNTFSAAGDPNEFYRDIADLLGENELNSLYLKYLDAKAATNWILNTQTSGDGTATVKTKGGRHNILIEKDGFAKSYTFHAFNDGTKTFKINLDEK